MKNPIDWLLSAEAIRERSQQIYQIGLSGQLEHFSVHPDKLEACAEFVFETTRENYPDLNVPFHSRWRHFTVNSEDRWKKYCSERSLNDMEKARIGFDIVFVSVLLDAGAGDAWTYKDNMSGETLSRSEGLAIASLDMFLRGDFSSDSNNPWQADAHGLIRLSQETLANGFQVSDANPLSGFDNRLELLRRLGRQVDQRFGCANDPNPRVSAFLETLKNKYNASLTAGSLLHETLHYFVDMWPHGKIINNQCLGDVGVHSKVKGEGLTNNLVPFHKLSQWLSYSLVEPLEWAGISATDLDQMTGLPEYRNGGLFIDMGVLQPKEHVLQVTHSAAAEPIVEWRALTVCLLDELAMIIRNNLNRTADELPLVKILQGGTWTAGRKIAKQLRANGTPPIRLNNEGTVF